MPKIPRPPFPRRTAVTQRQQLPLGNFAKLPVFVRFVKRPDKKLHNFMLSGQHRNMMPQATHGRNSP
jgi:hypothetical protein